jgi:hypothetical protein
MEKWVLLLTVSVLACQRNDSPMAEKANLPMCTGQFKIEFDDPVTTRKLNGTVYGSKFVFDQSSVTLVASVKPVDLDDEKLKEMQFWPNSQQCQILKDRIRLVAKEGDSPEWKSVKKTANEFIGTFGWGRLVGEPYSWPKPTVTAVKNKVSQDQQCQVTVQYLEIIHAGQHDLRGNIHELLNSVVYDAFKLSSLQNQIFDSNFELTAAEYCDLISGNLWGEVEVRYNGQSWQGQRINFVEEIYF